MTRSRPYVPLRQCAGCGGRDAKTSMDRFTVRDDALVWDARSGRGGYLHREEGCRRSFVARKPFLRSLKVAVSRAERANLVRDPSES